MAWRSALRFSRIVVIRLAEYPGLAIAGGSQNRMGAREARGSILVKVQIENVRRAMVPKWAITVHGAEELQPVGAWNDGEADAVPRAVGGCILIPQPLAIFQNEGLARAGAAFVP